MRRIIMGTMLIAMVWMTGIAGCRSQQMEMSQPLKWASEKRSIVFEAYGISFVNPFETRKILTGEAVKSAHDASNVYLEKENGKITPLFHANDYRTLADELQRRDSSDLLVWTSGPYPVDNGNQIVFVSNRTTILDGITDKSLHMVDTEGKNEVIMLDSRLYGDIRIVDTFGAWVFAESADHSLILFNVLTREMKKFEIEGHVDAVSENATHVLYRKMMDDYVLPELWMFHVDHASEQLIGDMPDNYFAK